MFFQIEILREAVRYLSSENTKLRGRKFHVSFPFRPYCCTFEVVLLLECVSTSQDDVTSLRPLRVPYRSQNEKFTYLIEENSGDSEENVRSTPSLMELTRRVKAAVTNYHEVLATTCLVRLKGGSESRDTPEAQLARQSERLLQAKRELEKVRTNLLWICNLDYLLRKCTCWHYRHKRICWFTPNLDRDTEQWRQIWRPLYLHERHISWIWRDQI